MSIRWIVIKLFAKKEELCVIENEKITQEPYQEKTNADEILANNEQKPIKIKQVISKQPRALKPKVVNITVDPEGIYFKNKELNNDNRTYLLNRNYKEYFFYNIFTGKKESYLLRPRFNESPQHCFLTFEIAEYLKNFTSKVWLYQTKKPDIVFQLNNKEFGIEIETGKILKNNKNKIKYKSEILNKEYGSNWFFVVTNRNLATKYKKFGKTQTKLTIKNYLNKLSKLA